jgi:hypothetical protein
MEMSRKWKERSPVSVCYSMAKATASRRSVSFDLDLDDLRLVYHHQRGKCAVTGIPFDLTIGSDRRPSLDRINASVGYVSGNVRFVLSSANYMMRSYGLDFFLDVARHALTKSEAEEAEARRLQELAYSMLNRSE